MTITIHGQPGEANLVREKQAFLNMLRVYPTGCVSVVSDSYDYKEAVKKLWCGELVEFVKDRFQKAKALKPTEPHALVIRPDSGDMIDNALYTLKHLAEAYGCTQNALGYKTLSDEVKLIQGDGINMQTYENLLEALHQNKWSVTNLVAGSGGGLLQKVNRDTLHCAIKASFAKVEGDERSIRKETKGKTSKRGLLSVEQTEDGDFKVIGIRGRERQSPEANLLQLFFKVGRQAAAHRDTLQRARACRRSAQEAAQDPSHQA
jgi:nicotinamide phosphoribosyltransferase